LSAPDELLGWLEQWYYDQCDGDWEHAYGIRIGTLDNPGWSLRFPVGPEFGATFSPQSWEADGEWLDSWVEEDCLRIACGPCSLRRALALAREVLTP
jgi:hypothetical protein